MKHAKRQKPVYVRGAVKMLRIAQRHLYDRPTVNLCIAVALVNLGAPLKPVRRAANWYVTDDEREDLTAAMEAAQVKRTRSTRR